MCSCNQLPSGSPSRLAFRFCWEIILQCCPGKSVLFEVQFCTFLKRLKNWKYSSWEWGERTGLGWSVVSALSHRTWDLVLKLFFFLADFYSPITFFIKWIKAIYWKTCWNWLGLFLRTFIKAWNTFRIFWISNFNGCILGEMCLKRCCQNLLARFVSLKSHLLSFSLVFYISGETFNTILGIQIPHSHSNLKLLGHSDPLVSFSSLELQC